MEADTQIKRFGEHQNSFGFLRLAFASLVIVSHTPELADGDRHREILTWLFGTISFGEFAVDCFFIISGYLIVGSYVKQPLAWPYLKKRIARIYPGFVVASLLCIFLVAPLSGVSLRAVLVSVPKSLIRMFILMPPDIPGVFSGTHYAALDGSMWTIAYEFRCYLIVLLLGFMGAFRRSSLIAVFGGVLLCTFELLPDEGWRWLAEPPLSKFWLGDPSNAVRLTGIFLIGALFYLWRDRIHLGWRGACVAAIVLVSCLFIRPIAEPALAIFGSYLIFWFASWANSGLISRINNRNDISYGVYLYAFPTEKLLLWFWPSISILLAGLITFLASCICGWASWHFVEKPIMRYLDRRRKYDSTGYVKSS